MAKIVPEIMLELFPKPPDGFDTALLDELREVKSMLEAGK